MAPRTFAVLLSVLAAVALPCSSGSERVEGPESPPPLQEVASETRFQPDEIPLIKGPVSEAGLQAIFATPDISVGQYLEARGHAVDQSRWQRDAGDAR
jgi:hypothetical protein